ncbi:MAG TPA: hypothetical protein VGJ26_19685 [Pirellulales bacterium]
METLPKIRRGWFRFSLRTLLALVTGAAIALALVANQRHQSQYEERVAVELREQGFQIVRSAGPYDQWELGYFTNQPQNWWRIQARKLLGDRVWRACGPPHSFDDLTPLAGLTHLQWLDLDGTSVKDLTPLAKMKSLEWLWLSRTQVSDLSPLVRLKNLKSLDVWGAPVSQAEIEKLQEALPNCKINHSPFEGS